MNLKNPKFTTQTKLAEMLDRDPSLLDVLDRLGIRLGFGERTLGEAAECAGLDPETTCLICNVYTFEDYKPDPETLLRGEVLRFLFRLQHDLECHTLVEDRILTPMAWYIEHPQTVRSRDRQEHTEREELSEREKEILVSVAKGMLNKEIADQYNISIHTVISHRKNITRKTGIKTVAGLTVYALLNGLIDINTVE